MKKSNRLCALPAAMLTMFSVLNVATALACMPPPYPIPLSGVPDLEKNLPIVLPVVDSSNRPPPQFTSCPYSFDRLAGYANLNGIADSVWVSMLGSGSTSTTQQYPAWSATTVYVGGEQVSFNGASYKAKWWTQNEQPGSAAVWEAASASVGGIEVWSSTKAFTANTQVIYNDSVYSAKWWTQGETPSSNAFGAWTYIGPAPVAGEVPVTARPAPFSVRIDFVTSPWKATLTTATVENTSYTAGVRMEIRENGSVVASAPVTTMVADCPAPTPGAPVCTAKYLQTGSVNFVPVSQKYLSVWLCTAANVCRPSTRLRVPLEMYYAW